MVEGRLPAGAESWADAEGILNTFEHTGRPLRNLTWADYANYRKMTEYARHRDKIARAFDNRLRLGAVAIPIVGAGYGASQYFDDDVIESSVDSVPYVHPDYRPQSLTPGDTVEVDPSMISDSDLIRR